MEYAIDYDALVRIAHDLLLAIGEDPDREGLLETPRRFANAWTEFMDYDPGETEMCFESIEVDQMVLVSGMRMYSMCEHHLMPFWCDVSIGYIAKKQVLGLSKFARIAHQYAHRLQLQERLCHQIAREISRITETSDVAVLASGVHGCMVSRGIKTHGIMTSSAMYGAFREKHSVRDEFFHLLAQTKETK